LEVCKEQVEWARSEKRTFLRQRLEARLANLYLGLKDFSSALSLISRLLSEVRILSSSKLLLNKVCCIRIAALSLCLTYYWVRTFCSKMGNWVLLAFFCMDICRIIVADCCYFLSFRR
jgi:hypothetical protein